jgi:hypothetical protein
VQVRGIVSVNGAIRPRTRAVVGQHLVAARIEPGGLQHRAGGVLEVLAGRSQGCSPTTPSPRTSTTLPLSSVISQCRLISRAGTLPLLWMRMV